MGKTFFPTTVPIPLLTEIKIADAVFPPRNCSFFRRRRKFFYRSGRSKKCIGVKKGRKRAEKFDRKQFQFFLSLHTSTLHHSEILCETANSRNMKRICNVSNRRQSFLSYTLNPPSGSLLWTNPLWMSDIKFLTTSSSSSPSSPSETKKTN